MDDLIRRSDAIEHAEVNGESREFIRKMMDYLEDAEIVEPKYGEWVCKGDWAECSLCSADSGTIMDGLERVPRYTKFCPNCGARMKGIEDETY